MAPGDTDRKSKKDPVELTQLDPMSEELSMDIKSALNAIVPSQVRGKEKVEKTIKMDSTTDRDGNGQQQFSSEDQEQKGPMTEEQLQKALEHLQSLPAIKEHNLTVQLIEAEGKKFVLLKEPTGKILRRIPESELWTLPVVANEHEKGQLLRKTA